MNKDDIREQFSPLLDDELTQEERLDLEAALSHDAELLRELGSLKRMDNLYRSLPKADAPADLEARVREAVRPKLFRFGQVREEKRKVWPLLAAAAMLAIVAGTSWYVMGDRLAAKRQLAMVYEKSAPATQPAASAAPSEQSRAMRLEEVSMQAAAADEAAPAAGAEGIRGLVRPEIQSRQVEVDVDLQQQIESLGYVGGTSSSAEAEANKLDMAGDGVTGKEQIALAAQPAPPAETQEVARVPSPAPETRDAATTQAEAKIAADAVASEPVALNYRGVPASPPPTPAIAPAAPSRRTSERLAQPQSIVAGQLVDDVVVTVKTVSNRQFNLINGIWTEAGYKSEPATALIRGSEEYTAFLKSANIPKEILDLGDQVLLKHKDAWYLLLPPVTP